MQLGISYDRFIRTTEANHEKIVDEFYRRVLDNGDIYRADYEGLYCVNCEEYKVLHLPSLRDIRMPIIRTFSVAEAESYCGFQVNFCLMPLVLNSTWQMGESFCWQDEKELTEDKQCPVHRKPCEPRKEDNYFFSLAKYQQQIDDLLTTNPHFVRPSFRRNEVRRHHIIVFEVVDNYFVKRCGEISNGDVFFISYE